MNAPLSGKQKREDMKFLFDELRKNSAYKKEQRRKEQLHAQQMAHKDESHSAKLEVPPQRSMPMAMPTNPEAGPNDKIPALLSKGEAVIPSKAAQDPMNKPLIKAMIREGRSDRNLSVPMPKGFNYGTTNVQGYFAGTGDVEPMVDYSGATAADVVSLDNPQDDNYKRLLAQLANQTNKPAIDQMISQAKPIAVAPLAAPQDGVQVAGLSDMWNTIKEKISGTTLDDINTEAQNNKNKFIEKLPTSAKKLIETINPNSVNNTPVVTTDKSYIAPLSNPVDKDGKLIFDLAEYQRFKESNNNYSQGKHENSNAWGPYGIMPDTFKELQKNDPYFKDKKLETLTPEEHDRAWGVTAATYGDQLSRKKIEPTDANVRLAAFLGADGAAQYLKDGTISKKAQDQNGGLAKARAIAEQRLAGPAQDQDYLNYLKNKNVITDKNIKDNRLIVPPSADRNLGNVTALPVIEVKAEDQKLSESKEVPPKPISESMSDSAADPRIPTIANNYNKVPEPSGFEKWGNVISTSIDSAYKTIADPSKLKEAVGSSLETLGFNSRDAARFASMVVASKALGYNTTQAVRYAGNYTLQASDRRSELEQQLEARKNIAETTNQRMADIAALNRQSNFRTAMVGKGYLMNDKGEFFAPPSIKTGNPVVLTFDNGPGANKPIAFDQIKNPISGAIELVDSLSGKTNIQIMKENGNRALIPYSERHSPSGQDKAYGSWLNESGKGIEDILGFLGPSYNTKEDKPNPIRSKLPTSSAIATDARSVFKAWGYNPDNADIKTEMTKILNNATRKMVNKIRANTGGSDIESAEPYIINEILMAKTGIDNKLFITQEGNLTETNKIVEQKNNLESVLAKANPQASLQEVNDLVINKYKELENQWNNNPELRKKFDAQATKKDSGFYFYVNDNLKSSQK